MNDFYKMAVRSISKKGDTDIFPFPIENALFYDKPEAIVDILQDMDKAYNDSGKATPVDSIKTSIPVGYTGFRWATLIDPAWNAFFLAEVLNISGQIEQKRIPVEENCIFSYRMNYDEENGTLFDREVNWKAFYENSGKIAVDNKYQSILSFDISDFYNRIYHERLRDVLLTEVGADINSVDRIIGLVSGIATWNDPYGLPVGGNASRILAEAFLIRSDNFMKESGIKFCRFVDDYIVFADSAGHAYNLLNSCADYFQREMGLSLQKNKTSIMTQSEFTRHIKSVFDEIEGDKDPARTSFLKLNLNVDPYSATADDELRDLKDQIDGSGIIRLLKAECRKTRINQFLGKQLIRAVQYLDIKDISEAFTVLSFDFEKFYPVFPNIMRAAYYNLLKCDEKTINIFIDRISKLVESNSYIIQPDNNASYAMRVLSLVKSELTEKTISKLYERHDNLDSNTSALIRMNAVYAMTNLGNFEWIHNRLNEFPQLSPWERRAVVAASAFLAEEGKSWRNKCQADCSPLEKLIGEWTSEKRSDNPNWKLPL